MQMIGDGRMFALPPDLVYTGLEDYLRVEREKNLNWNFEPGHCILCGGIEHGRNADHYLLVRHNEKLTDKGWFTSLLLHKQGAWVKVFTDLVNSPRYTKEKLMAWVTLFLELNPEKCFAVASRELEDWWEIRLGFHELQDESYDQRAARTGRVRAPGGGENSSGSYSSASSTGGGIQGAESMAGGPLVLSRPGARGIPESTAGH